MKTKYNCELKTIDTKEKAYLLGLFYSDGCISSTDNTCSILGEEKTIKNLFSKIITYFPFFKIYNHSISKINGNKYLKLSCTNKQLKEDLLNLGVYSKKSLSNLDNLRFPKLDKDFYKDFLRGYFDGDGYFVKNNSKYKIKAGIGSVNYYFICDILKILFENNISFHITFSSVEKMNSYKKKWNILSTKNMYYIQSLSFKEILKFIDYIYTDSILFIDYKKEIALDCIEYSKNFYLNYLKKENIPCPKCKNERCCYNGIRGKIPRQRMTCSKCNYRFTIDIPNIAHCSSNITEVQDQLIQKE